MRVGRTPRACVFSARRLEVSIVGDVANIGNYGIALRRNMRLAIGAGSKYLRA